MNKLFFILIFLTSCSSSKAPGDGISVISQPAGALVQAIRNDGKLIDLGQTPLRVDLKSSSIRETKKDHIVSLMVSRSGYVPQRLMVDTTSRKLIEVEVGLTELTSWTNPDSEVSSQYAESLIVKIQQVNRLKNQKQLPEAISKVDGLIQQYPKASVLYSMKGSLQLLLGQKEGAMASYQQSLAINKDNIEAKQMLEKLQGGKP